MSENCEEERVKQWLKGQKYTDICRPSKDPPDFVVDNRIAVEVRRLNWMDDSGKGVESVEYGLEKTIGEVLGVSGPPPGSYNVHVECQTHGALPKKNKTEKLVRQAVGQYVKKINAALKLGIHPKHWTPGLECGIRLIFSCTPASGIGKFQVKRVEADAGSRGWPSDSIDNINRCIEKKTKKIQGKIHYFPEWWLVLVPDKIFPPESREQDRWQTIRDGLVDTGPWSRIIVLSGLSGLMHVDLIDNLQD